MADANHVVVIGAGGAQAQAMLDAARRARSLEGWVAVDRSWQASTRAACEALDMEVVELDLLAEPERLRELAARVDLVANFAGPFYRTGTAVLEACIDVGCDYLDICDDADATLQLLQYDGAAREADVRALLGMGSSPGVTNVLIRAAHDHLGGAGEADLFWAVDVTDMNAAALQHLWHGFSPIGPDGGAGEVPAWEQLHHQRISFPSPIGEAAVVELSHPEPVTIPRFLGIDRVRNFGGVVPEDALVMNWAMARGGAGTENGSVQVSSQETSLQAVATTLYAGYMDRREPSDYLGGGFVIDVRRNGTGVRFASADKVSMEESTGIPAAAGITLMLDGSPQASGVIAPECLDPAAFFSALGGVSRGTGSLHAYRLEGEEQGERIRIRDLLAR
jgi:saccharopine dehydrogenase (NAD+, L-lysine-forming)